MKSIVFGGNGFIGSHLVDLLLVEGHRVRVFDHVPERFRAPLSDVDYYLADFADPFAVAEALDGVDVVFHLISTTVPSTSNRDPVADVKSNLVCTVQLLEQVVKAGVKRVVFLSSGGTVYGNPQRLPIPESHPLAPVCSYGVVKIAIEKYLFMYEHLHGIEPMVLRGSNPFGPRQGHGGVQGFIATALSAVLHNVPLDIWGDGSVVRDYVYVRDFAQLCLTAGMSNERGVFNAGSGKGHSLNDVVACIGEVVGQTPEIVKKPPRGFDVREVVLDTSLAAGTFQWAPKHTLSEGIRLTWEWMQQHKNDLPAR